MAKITAFKCDACGSIYEDRKPVVYIETDASEFHALNYQRYGIDVGACSDDCALAMFKAWICERGAAAELKQVVLVGGQVA